VERRALCGERPRSGRECQWLARSGGRVTATASTPFSTRKDTAIGGALPRVVGNGGSRKGDFFCPSPAALRAATSPRVTAGRGDMAATRPPGSESRSQQRASQHLERAESWNYQTRDSS
jgi:hypothetical protein